MICDSPEQKNFLLEAVRKYPCNYEMALQLANQFGQSIQDAQIIPIKTQHEKFPPPKLPIPAGPVTVTGDGKKVIDLKAKDLKAVAGNGKAGKKGGKKEAAK